MNLAILHYHLNRGGVTRVVENQLASLGAVLDEGDPWRVALVYGGRREGFREDLCRRLRAVRLFVCEVPLLDYDNERQDDAGQGPEELYRRITAVLDELQFDPRQTVLHVHNHALGKNRLLPETVSLLAQGGYAILLQIHDFAEDLRGDNYRGIGPTTRQALYPQAEGIHYAVLNGRDYEVLRQAGVDTRRLHLLPNPVPPMDHLPPRAEARRRLAEQFDVEPGQRLILYPARCIRRKNVGEALLYSTLGPRGAVVGLTLPPLNPVEVPIYESWKRLAAELELPCRFELGTAGALGLAESLAAADLILTTSVAEGFGMVFLESWLAGRPLVGRDLPEVTGDFAEAGLRFEWLRPRLRVPVEWVGIHAFRRTVLEAYRRTLGAYGREEPGGIGEQLDARTADGLVDFGDLDETLQEQVLRIVCRSEEDRRRVLECNDPIEHSLSIRSDDARQTIRQNAQAIEGHFSLVPSGRRLLQLYEQVAASPRGRQPQRLPHAERILDRFLDFRRFRPIRS